MTPLGVFNRVEIYAGERHLVTYNSTNGQAYFVHSDWQGTERVRSSYTGGSYEKCWNTPYGDNLTCTNVLDISPLHYTGKQRDTETNLDYFGARYYSSGMARWMSPDWANKPTTVPYANFGDPQSLNLYGYVTNNPVSKQDDDGHLMSLREEEESWGGGVGGGTVSGAIGADNPVTSVTTIQPDGSRTTTVDGGEFQPSTTTVQAQQQVSFSTLAANYPGHDAYPTDPHAPNSIWSLIGGHVAMNAFATDGGENNSCAVRMSYDLNASGVPIPKGKGTVSGADGKQYFLRVADLQKFLTGALGPPQYLSGGSFAGPSGSTGIISFNIPFKYATGHFTLWNGHQVADPKEPYSSWPAPTSTLFWGVK